MLSSHQIVDPPAVRSPVGVVAGASPELHERHPDRAAAPLQRPMDSVPGAYRNPLPRGLLGATGPTREVQGCWETNDATVACWLARRFGPGQADRFAASESRVDSGVNPPPDPQRSPSSRSQCTSGQPRSRSAAPQPGGGTATRRIPKSRHSRHRRSGRVGPGLDGHTDRWRDGHWTRQPALRRIPIDLVLKVADG
jgi:hypothetical protein